MKLTTSKLRFVCAFPSVIKPMRRLTGLVAALWIFMGMDVLADNEADWFLSSNQSSVPPSYDSHTITIVGTSYDIITVIDGLNRPPWQTMWEVYSDTDLTSDGSYTLDSGYYVSMDDLMEGTWYRVEEYDSMGGDSMGGDSMGEGGSDPYTVAAGSYLLVNTVNPSKSYDTMMVGYVDATSTSLKSDDIDNDTYDYGTPQDLGAQYVDANYQNKYHYEMSALDVHVDDVPGDGYFRVIITEFGSGLDAISYNQAQDDRPSSNYLDGLTLNFGVVEIGENTTELAIDPVEGLTHQIELAANQILDFTIVDIKLNQGKTAVSEIRVNESNWINPSNTAPTELALSNAGVAENEAVGTVVGAFSTTDADTGDMHTYTLVSGTDDTDNGKFTIMGSSLETNATFDYEVQSSQMIRVKTDDGNGGTFEQAFTISITDIVEDTTAPGRPTLTGPSLTNSVTVTGTAEAGSTVKVYYDLFWQQLGADIDGEAANDYSGTSVSLSSDGTVAAIGATHSDGNGGDSGHVRIYAWNGSAWQQRGDDIDGEAANDQSGKSVSLSSDGTVVAIGAQANDGNGTNSGHTRIYAWDGSAWVKRGADINGEKSVDLSGFSVSLSSDGTLVAIGAFENDANGNKSGHTRIYAWNGSAWQQRGGDIDGEAANDQSGYSVSLSADGIVVGIGARWNDGNGTNSGHTRIYAWNGSAWQQRGGDIDGEAEGDYSGFSVSLSADGSIAAIGAYGNDGISGSGHTRIYAWDGSAWQQRGDDIDGEAVNEWSGYSVSLSADGTAVAIGALLSGHTRIYTWDGSAWLKSGVDIVGEAAGDRAGTSVSLSADGTAVAIGALLNNDNGSNSGHVRIYQLSPLTLIGQTTADANGDYNITVSTLADGSHDITATATDTANNTSVTSVAHTVVVDTTAPTITSAATGTDLAENSGAGQTVYTITASDAVGVASYAIGGTDAALLTLTGNVVSLDANPDYEIKFSYSFTVIASDAAGNTSAPKTVTFSITNVNDTVPTIAGVNGTSFAENSGAGQTIYTIHATANDGGTISSYAIGGTDVEQLHLYRHIVRLTADPDYETKNSYSFTVTASDAAGTSNARTVTFSITNVDEVAPTITSSATGTSLAENSGAGQTVYTIAADANDGGTISSYAIGGTNAGLLSVNASTGVVSLTADPDYETRNSYSFTVTASDAAGTSAATTVTFSITDVADTAPVVTNVSSATADGSYNTGDTVAVTVEFSEAVTVSGTPTLTLETGSTDQVVDYASGSGSDTLTFNYTVQSGDTSSNLDYTSNSALATPNNLNLVGSYSTSGTPRYLTVSGNYAYVPDGVSGLQIIDISTPEFPSPIGSYDGEPGETVNAWDVAVSGDYAYVGDRLLGLQIVDVSDPFNLSLTGSYSDGGGISGVTVSGNYAYLVSSRDFRIVDITNKSNPISSGSTTIWTGGGDQGISVVVSGDYAYVANNGGGLATVDISDKASPTVTDNYGVAADRSGAGWPHSYPNDINGIDVEVSGDYVYMSGRKAGLLIFDISTPGSPTLAGSYDQNTSSTDNTYSAWGVALSGDYAFVAHTASLDMVDISDPTNPSMVASYGLSGTSGIPQGVSVSGGYAYVSYSGETNEDLHIISLGASINDGASNAATLTLAIPGDEGSLGYNKALVIDTTAPTITSGATGTDLAENSGVGHTVYTITASDAVGVASYAIGGTDAALLTLTGNVVSLDANPDYEIKFSYSFTVTASDAVGNASAGKTVTFSITNVDEVVPTITSGATGTILVENSGAGQTVYTIAADANDGGTISSYAIGGTDVALLAVNPTTGVVNLTADPDYETKSSYSFTVTASDADGTSAATAVTFSITDVVENTAPVISSVTITPNSPNVGDTLTVSATASDADQDTITLSYHGQSTAKRSVCDR